MDRIDELIQQIELEYVESVTSCTEERKKLLPLRSPKQIKALIWNLLSSEKWRKQISYSDYEKILDVWIANLKNNNTKRTCFFCESELAEWQPKDDNICNVCADEIKAEKHEY